MANTLSEHDSPGMGRNIWAVAGGKGGTGKSVVTANIGIGLALLGYRVILVDGDLGGPNLHNYLNLKRPRHTLTDFISNKVKKLDAVVLSTPVQNLYVISGGTEMLGTANIPHQTKEKLLRHLAGLQADYVIIDLGAGTTHNTIDMFNLATRGFLICNPEPNAKYDAFYFLKNAIFRNITRYFPARSRIGGLVTEYLQQNGTSVEIGKLLAFIGDRRVSAAEEVAHYLQDYRPQLVMNKVRTNAQVREGDWFVSLVKNYLGVEMDYVGYVRYDDRVVTASENITPFLFRHPRCRASRDLYEIVVRLIPTNGHHMSFRSFRGELKRYSKQWA